MKTDNEGHLDAETCKRNREACQNQARNAVKHSEENRKVGNTEAAHWWLKESERNTNMAAYWREQWVARDREEQAGNPLEADMR